MPFTPSHAVVALPFVRTPLVPAGIAVGAMAPDLPLYVGVAGPLYLATHALVWLPATVALSALLLLVWRCALRPAVRELSPGILARRLPASWDRGAAAALRETFPSWPATAWLTAALAIGVAAHGLWDAFSHEGRAGVEALPMLAQAWGPLPGYKWVQYGSGLLGGAVLAAWACVWLRRRAPEGSPRRLLPAAVRVLWWVSLPVILVAAWIAGWLVWGPFTREFTPAHLVYRVLPQAAAAWGMLSLALAVLVQVRRARREDAAGSA